MSYASTRDPSAAWTMEAAMSETTTAGQLIRTVEGAELPVAGTYVLDTAHTVVGFVVRHMMVSKVRGAFNEFEGSIVVGEDPFQTSAQVEIKINSIDTREPKRDEHLRTADFFEVEKFPLMTFTSTKFSRHGSDWKLDGNLTVRDVTRPVTLDVEFNGASPDPWGGTRIGFSAATEINREDFGLTYNAAIEAGGVVIGTKVRIEIEAEAVRQD
jgi:polyisoprenoid-binding protein YceI